MTDKPIALGTALVTMVEPHRGHAVAYNRWYERDHFYAGCMIGAHTFAGGRFVATRECKDLRYPADSPIASPVDQGSYIALYWILDGHHDEWNRWAVDQVNWLHENGRMFTDRDHVHTLMYRYSGEQQANDDGIPSEVALDHHFRGLVVAIGEMAPGVDDQEIEAFYSARPCPADVRVAFTPIPLLDDAPGDVPRDTVDNRFLHLYFTDDDVVDVWAERYAALGDELAASGLGRIVFVAPFLSTVWGTDTYTDQLW
ncbi:MAG: hypothetical protein JWL73_3391 [Actinomycetia bacterium]|nr:hypothetical protein [Actinomycetes bacterium]